LLFKNAVNLEVREGILQKPVRHALLEIFVMATMGTEVLRVCDGRPVGLLTAPTTSRDRVGGDRPPAIVRGVAHALILSGRRATATQPRGY
jgi:hypothetical protein